MITKNLVVKFQNLVVNHESGPVKWNPGYRFVFAVIDKS